VSQLPLEGSPRLKNIRPFVNLPWGKEILNRKEDEIGEKEGERSEEGDAAKTDGLQPNTTTEDGVPRVALT